MLVNKKYCCLGLIKDYYLLMEHKLVICVIRNAYTGKGIRRSNSVFVLKPRKQQQRK